MPRSRHRTDFGAGWIVRGVNGEPTRITLRGAGAGAGVGEAGVPDVPVEPWEQCYAGAASLDVRSAMLTMESHG